MDVRTYLTGLGTSSSDVTFEYHRETRAQTNARLGKFAAQNVLDVSTVVALSYGHGRKQRLVLEKMSSIVPMHGDCYNLYYLKLQ